MRKKIIISNIIYKCIIYRNRHNDMHIIDYGDAIIFYIIDDSLILITIIIFVLDFILFYVKKI